MSDLPNPLPTGDKLCELADRLYEQGKDDALRELAQKVWPVGGMQPGPGVAEVCRLAEVVCVRLARECEKMEAKSVDYWAEADILRARSYTAACFGGDKHVISLLSQKHFFSLVDKQRFDLARSVLDAMELLVEDPSTRRPWARIVKRILAERRAYSYHVEGRYDDADKYYQVALPLAGDRGRLKVRGGIAINNFMRAARDQTSREALRFGLVQLTIEAEDRFPDVFRTAKENIMKVDDGAVDGFVPFDVV
jgi:hypothetical protein